MIPMMILPNLMASIDLEYLPLWKAAGIFVGLALPVVILGMLSLNGLGAVRKWVSITMRLLVLALLVLILAGAIQYGLATFSNDAMRRILLITDGNQNAGDLDAALTAAAAQHVPIDVMPLTYNVLNEVIVERLVAPSFRRENDAFDISVVLM